MNATELPVAPGRAVYVSRAAFDERRVGAAAVYCSDGRFGEQMDEFLHAGLGLPRYDRVAIPGGAACLAGHVGSYHEGQALGRQLGFLIDAHGLRQVVLIAHDGCAFYKDIWTAGRTVERQQAVDLQRAAAHVQLRHPGVEVAAYFARRVGRRVVFERWSDGNTGYAEPAKRLLEVSG